MADPNETAAAPRALAVAQWMRDREDGTTGWINTTPAHRANPFRAGSNSRQPDGKNG